MGQSSLIDPEVLSSSDFNRLISHIHDQTEIPEDVLQSLATIYRAHSVDDKYGCQLLHRHYDMPENCIPLTTESGNDVSVTKVTPLGKVNYDSIRGQLYLLNNHGKFQAYEYEHGPPVKFPHAFLQELAAFIEEKGLHDKICLTSSIDEKVRTEIQLGSQATVTFPPKYLNSPEESHNDSS